MSACKPTPAASIALLIEFQSIHFFSLYIQGRHVFSIEKVHRASLRAMSVIPRNFMPVRSEFTRCFSMEKYRSVGYPVYQVKSQIPKWMLMRLDSSIGEFISKARGFYDLYIDRISLYCLSSCRNCPE